MDRLRHQLLDPFVILISGSSTLRACTRIDVPHALLISLPTVFHSFGRMALLDDDVLALPENLSLECRLCNQ